MTHQEHITSILIQQATEKASPLLSLVADQTVSDACWSVFASVRGKDGSKRGMLLSEVGLQLMRSFFKCHDIKLAPGYKVKTTHLIYMDRVNRMPYWFNDTHAILFDSEVALMLRMVDGDIQRLIDTRFRLDPATEGLKAE